MFLLSEVHFMSVSVVLGDITLSHADAIVNAANCSLLGGSGVDGAIHRAAGPRLLEACRALNGCETGQAKLTPAFDLPCRYVIHTPGPIWRGGQYGEAALLTSCYRSCLELAAENGLESVAFCCISTGEFHFPNELAAEIAVQTVKEFLKKQTSVKRVIFNVFKDLDKAIYEKLLRAA